MLLVMVKKTMNQHVLKSLTSITITSTSFDLWMSHGNVDTFALDINFLSDMWISMHITMGLFEVNETTQSIHGCTTLIFVREVGLLHWVIAFAKDEGTNLATMATTLHSIINCEPLKILKVYEVS